MTLWINGETREVEEGLTLSSLLTLLKVSTPQVAVEVNAAVVRRADHAGHALKDGDRVEIVTFVGGG